MKSPPRAMSIEKGSPHYRSDWHVIGPMIDVLLDGRTVNKVIAFDCDAGTVKRYATDDDGRLMLRPSGAGAHAETVRGQVTVRWNAKTHA